MEEHTPNQDNDLEKLVASLKQQRDELSLQLHLAKAEARDEWNELEGRWERMRGKLEQARQVAGETGQEVGAAASLLAEEIARGYERIRRLF